MKARTKALIASVVVIAMALSAVSGITITLINSKIYADKGYAIKVGTNAKVVVKINDDTTWWNSSTTELVAYKTGATVSVIDLDGKSKSSMTLALTS